jgi:hypothetical protein
MPSLRCKEVSQLNRVSLEVQLALNSNLMGKLELTHQCSGAHLRRTGIENPAVGTFIRYQGSFRLSQILEVGSQEVPFAPQKP